MRRGAWLGLVVLAMGSDFAAAKDLPPPDVYQQPWPHVHRREQRMLQPLVQMVAGDRLTGAARAAALEVCADGRNPGSANHAGLAVAVRYGAWVRGECAAGPVGLPAARRIAQDFFESQLDHDGFMAPWGRDETLAQGYGDLHLAISAALLRFSGADPGGARVRELSLRWLRGWTAIHALAESDAGVVYLPYARAGGGSPRVVTAALRLLTGRPWRERGEMFYRRQNAAGVPQNTGPWALREAVRSGDLTVPLRITAADLPLLRHELHILRTDRALVAWMVGLEERGRGDTLLRPVAGSIAGREVGEQTRRGAAAAWPTRASPGFPVPGRVLEHWLGGPDGWQRLAGPS
jgi:hypothetical protein